MRSEIDQLMQHVFPDPVKAVRSLIMPVGWVGEWHERPEPQWVIPLAGRWCLESAAGQRIEMGPGDPHWGQDFDTREGRGHRSGQLGDVPCVSLMLQFEDIRGTGRWPL